MTATDKSAIAQFNKVNRQKEGGDGGDVEHATRASILVKSIRWERLVFFARTSVFEDGEHLSLTTNILILVAPLPQDKKGRMRGR